MDDNKQLNENDLKNVDGGFAFATLKKNLLESLPLNVRQQLARAKSDNEACQILANSGVDYQSIEKQMKEVFAGNGKDLYALNDIELEKIAGGFETEKYGDIECWECEASNRDDFSYQFWASTFLTEGSIYRCKKCGTYQIRYDKHNLRSMDKEKYNSWVKEHFEI